MSDSLSRRRFLQASSVAVAIAGLPACALAKIAGRTYASHLGFQSYTVRESLERDPRDTLTRVAAIGYKEVELYDPAHAVQFAPIVKKLGLDMVSTHIPEFFADDAAWAKWNTSGRPVVPAGYDLAGMLKIAREHNLRYIGYPHGAPDGAYGSAENYRLYSLFLDGVGAECRKAGIKFFYHNHHHEFGPVAGGNFLDIMVKTSRPENLCFEIDVCWATHAGQDPVALLEKLAGRVRLLHLKDRKRGVPTTTGPGWPQDNIFAEVGSGSLDVPAILRAAHAADIPHVFVEQDETEGDPVDSLAKSYAYVQKVGL